MADISSVAKLCTYVMKNIASIDGIILTKTLIANSIYTRFIYRWYH